MLQVCSHCRCFFQDGGPQVCVCSREMKRVGVARRENLLDAGYVPLVREVLTPEVGALPEVRGMHLIWEDDRPSISFIEFVGGTRWWLSSEIGKAVVYAQTRPEQS